MTIHVCLLYSGGPGSNQSISSFHEEQVYDPIVYQSFPSLFRAIWVWFLLLFRKRTPLLEGPCPSFSRAEKHAKELHRLLGPDFRCHAIHHFGDANIEAFIKALPQSSKVVLIPLIPHRCKTLFSMLTNIRKELQKKQCKIIEWKPFARNDAFIETLCIQIRKSIINNGDKDYGLLFIEQRQPERWNRSSLEYREDLEFSIKTCIQRLQSQQPYMIGHTQTSHVKKQLKEWQKSQIQSIITIPTSWFLESELLRNERKLIEETAKAVGIEKIVHAEPFHTPQFDQYICTRLWNILEHPKS